MTTLIECVPNFSEGRRADVVESIVAAARDVPAIRVLDVNMDPDYNRSVLTMVGPPAAVAEAAFRVTARAAQLISLDRQQGEHPRIGATDVVPFIPLERAMMEECVVLARRVGQRIGTELDIPVYLYEEAAMRPARRNLADVRRGEYEGLRAEIAVNPDRAPDFGPCRVGPAGATAVGARFFLVAFNVSLGTQDLRIAQAIAKAVRHSGGGLRYVKALGIPLEHRGIVQVSMNLTDFTRTPLHRVLQLIRAEASRYGVPITGSEIIGLVPQQVLLDAAAFYLQIQDFSPEVVLENRLKSTATAADPLREGSGLPQR